MRQSLTGPNGSCSHFESLEDRRLLSSAPPYANATDNDLAYGTDGSLHVAWYDTQAGSLQYASRSAAGAWSNAVTVDSIPGLPAGQTGIGYYVSLALDSQNRPALAYFDGYNADLKLAARDANNSWIIRPTIETVAAIYPSLAFNGGDMPLVSYYVTGNKDLKLARWTGSAWHRQVVDGADDVGRSSSLHRIPGSPDRFAIAYEHTTSGDFKYAEVTPAGYWAISTVDTEPLAGGGFTSLAFDNVGNPAFSYYDSWTSTLKYANRVGSSWTVSGVSGRISYYTNLWFNPSDGTGHLVYYDISGNLLNHLTKPTPTGNWTSPNAELHLGGGNRVSAAFKNDGTIAFSWGPPITATSTPMGVGTQAGNIVQAPSLGTPTVVSSSRIDVSWSYSGSANSGFKIGLSTDGGRTFPDERIVASASARSAQITGLNGSTTYTFTVRAYNSAGDSAYSSIASGTTPIAPPAAPNGLAATVVSSSRIDLSWNDVAGETSYQIERSTGTSGWTQVASLSANVTAYSNTGLTGNTTYNYRIRATNGGGSSSFASFNPLTTLIDAPATFTATTQSTTRINLAWSAVSGATAYVVEQLDGASYVDIANLSAATTEHSVPNLSAGEGYTFRVRAIGAGSGNTAVSASASATTMGGPASRPGGTPQAVVHDPDATGGDAFGQAMAVSGNLIVSGNSSANGGSGAAVVMDASTGTVVRRLPNPGASSSITGFGSAVAFANGRIAISAPDGDSVSTPRVYVYDDLEDDVPDLIIAGATTSSFTGFGTTLAAIGNDLLVQEQFVNGGSNGAVYRYELGYGTVEQTFVATNPNDVIGSAMAADAVTDTVLLSTNTSAGMTVIEFNATTGVALREFAITGAHFLSVAYSPDSIFVGSLAHGEVYEYDRSDLSSTPSPVHTYVGPTNTQFGASLAVAGDQLLVTAPVEQELISENDEVVAIATGAAYVFNHATEALIARIANPTPDALGNSGIADLFGSAVGVLDGDIFAISDPADDDGSLIDVGGVYTFDV